MVISYDTLRREIDTLAAIRWNYVVLDEGHAIRNPKGHSVPLSFLTFDQVHWHKQ